MEKAQKAGFFSPDKREYHTSKCNGKNKKKEQGERKEEKGEKVTFALLWVKKKNSLAKEVLIGGNAFQNPATDIFCA